MYFLLKMVIFHCYFSLPEGKSFFFCVAYVESSAMTQHLGSHFFVNARMASVGLYGFPTTSTGTIRSANYSPYLEDQPS